MPSKKAPRHIVPLLRGAIDTFVNNPVILIPFLTIAFIQLLILEMLYFFPRFPLSMFFNPIVSTLWGSEYIHYPNNFIILPKLFQNAQVFLYLFVSCFFIAVAIAIISNLNNGQKINVRSICRETFGQYIHIFAAALLSFCLFFGLHKLYNLLMDQVIRASSVEGIFFMMKKFITYGAPFVNLLFGVIVTTMFAFVFPIIVIERKKIIAAIGLNFKHLWGSFWFIFSVIFLPTLLYVPVLLLRNNLGSITQTVMPEMRVIALIISILVTMIIDVIIYTAITTHYLLKREQA